MTERPLCRHYHPHPLRLGLARRAIALRGIAMLARAMTWITVADSPEDATRAKQWNKATYLWARPHPDMLTLDHQILLQYDPEIVRPAPTGSGRRVQRPALGDRGARLFNP
jgi:hypothetical protein